MEFIDKSDVLRSNQEVLEALREIKKELVSGVPRPVMMYFPTIIDVLKELLIRRQKDGDSSGLK